MLLDITLSTSFFNLLADLGKKPWKINLSVLKPETISADKDALGPGTTIGSTLLIINFFINSDPGSDINGVPASEINDIFFDSLRLLIISGKIFLSFDSWYEIILTLLIFKCDMSFNALFFFSQIIMLLDDKTSIALEDKSPRLPIGVETMKKLII